MLLLLLCMCLIFALLYSIGYQLASLMDLEEDHINPYDFASRMKPMIMAEFIIQGLVCFLYLITGNWFLTLLSVPYLFYNLSLYMRREHAIDVTEIFNLINWKKKEMFPKFAHTLFLLVISIIWVIWRCLEEDQRTLAMIAALSSEELAEL